MKRTGFVLLALAALAFWVPALPIAYAVQVPAVSPLDFAAPASVALEPEAHWIWTILASEVVAAIAGWLFLKVYELVKGSRYAKALLIIRNAVTTCYREYVRVIKDGRANGKLTIGEKDEALRYAYRKAVDMAQREGIDLLKVFAKETVLTLIERFVGEAKMPRAAKAVTGPLPDLAP